MPNVAILVGNIDYQKLDRLECCGDDLAAMKELLNATGKYDILEVIDNVEATELKARIRSVADANKGAGEVFFYFTGHGFQHESEFFACATNFDAKRPHDTGLSNEELHMLLRSMEPALVVKVVDACSSGTVLLKSIASFEPARRSPYGMGAMAHILGTVEETETVYDLHLNCDLDKAQLTIKLTPKFKSLKRLILVVSCAPSLENCYIFEVLTEHAWSGWKSFDEDGVELVRRWYKKSWRESADRTAEMISKKLNSIITEHVEAATKAP